MTGCNVYRWAIAVWILYCMILANAYGGNLKAWLTYPEKSKPINTLSDVIGDDLATNKKAF